MAKILARCTHKHYDFIPYWCTVYIVQHKDSRYVYITSRIHVRRLARSGCSYGSTYNRPILNDVHCREFINRFA